MNVLGAGVVPYCTFENRTYFLLGEEAFGTDAGHFSDFGGRAKGREPHLHTAAREASEESRGVLGSSDAIKDLLWDITPYQIQKNKEGTLAYYMYFLPINPEKMNCRMNAVCRCFVCAFNKALVSKTSWLEKRSVAWVNADDVFRAVSVDYGLINSTGMRIRNAFCYALKRTPEYRAWYIEHINPFMELRL